MSRPHQTSWGQEVPRAGENRKYLMTVTGDDFMSMDSPSSCVLVTYRHVPCPDLILSLSPIFQLECSVGSLSWMAYSVLKSFSSSLYIILPYSVLVTGPTIQMSQLESSPKKQAFLLGLLQKDCLVKPLGRQPGAVLLSGVPACSMGASRQRGRPRCILLSEVQWATCWVLRGGA